MWSEISKLLTNKKISIYRLSKLTGIPENTLRSYKKSYAHPGDVNISFINVCKIADALNVSLDDLRGDK